MVKHEYVIPYMQNGRYGIQIERMEWRKSNGRS